MTLSISLVAPSQVILVTDRRFTNENGSLCTDEGSKLTVFFCRDARAAIAYTGLAKTGTFSTHEWLLGALLEAAKPDFQLRSTLDRLAEAATRKLASLRISPQNSRLSIVLCGNYYGEPPPLAFLCRITNFENDDGSCEASARNRLSVTCLRERRNPEGVPTKLFLSGVWRAVPESERRELEQLLAEDKPTGALIGKSIEVIRGASMSPRSGGLIGRECMSAVIPRAPNSRIVTGYHPDAVTMQTLMPSSVIALSPQQSYWVSSVSLTALTGPHNPMPPCAPKVGRNRPCPCGSGKKYKHCHGRADRLSYRSR